MANLVTVVTLLSDAELLREKQECQRTTEKEGWKEERSPNGKRHLSSCTPVHKAFMAKQVWLRPVLKVPLHGY